MRVRVKVKELGFSVRAQGKVPNETIMKRPLDISWIFLGYFLDIFLDVFHQYFFFAGFISTRYFLGGSSRETMRTISFRCKYSAGQSKVCDS
jgi:hypothetical protein